MCSFIFSIIDVGLEKFLVVDSENSNATVRALISEFLWHVKVSKCHHCALREEIRKNKNLAEIFVVIFTMSAGEFSLFVGDLTIFCTEEDLLNVFSQFGTILNVRIIKDNKTRKALSYGFVEYTTATSAIAAMRQLNGSLLCGRPIRFIPLIAVSTG